MVEVDRFDLEKIISVCCRRIYVLINLAGVERGVVKVADGKRCEVCGRWQEFAAPAHEVYSEGHLCVEAKVEAMTSAPVTGGPAAVPASESESVGVGANVVARHCF